MNKILTRETMLYFRDKVVEKLQDDTLPIQKRIEYIERVLTELAGMLPNKEVLKRATWSEWLREIKKMLEKEQGGKMMNNIREKLVELLKENCHFGQKCPGECTGCMADHLIANGVMIQEWIPVNEPPKENGRYYVNVKMHDISYVKIVSFYNESVAGLHDKGWYDYDSDVGFYEEKNITHWSHLPPPPKGE